MFPVFLDQSLKKYQNIFFLYEYWKLIDVNNEHFNEQRYRMACVSGRANH